MCVLRPTQPPNLSEMVNECLRREGLLAIESGCRAMIGLSAPCLLALPVSHVQFSVSEEMDGRAASRSRQPAIGADSIGTIWDLLPPLVQNMQEYGFGPPQRAEMP